MPQKTPGKHPILRSFDRLVKAMDDSPPQQDESEAADPQGQPEQRTIMDEGVVLGRKWRLYSDAKFEGETVLGMKAFKDLDHFKTFIEGSPVLRTERSMRSEVPSTEPIQPITGPSERVPAGAIGSATASTASGRDIRSTHSKNNQDHSTTKPVSSHPNAELARDLVIGGGVGLVLCLAWWLRFYVFTDLYLELLRRGMSGSMIRSTNLSVPHYLPCLVLDAESCIAMKNWGRFARYLVYEPPFLWASICALGLGLLLVHVQRRG